MWGVFCVDVLVSLLLLIVPGTLVLRSFRLPWTTSLALSAPVSVALAQILFILYSKVHLAVGIVSFVLPLAVILLAIWVITEIVAHRRARTHTSLHDVNDALALPHTTAQRWWLAAAFVLAFVLTIVIYVRALSGPASFNEHYDTAWHYSIARHFVESGDYSTLHSGSIAPTTGSQFYPTGWHALVALTALLTHAQITVAANAVNTMIFAFIFPLCMIALLRWMFRAHPEFWIPSAMCIMLFAPYPWRYISFGPLFSNFLSYAILPVLLLEGLALLNSKTSWPDRWRLLALFITSAIGVAIAQPNSIFTAAVILAIYLFWQVPRYVRAAGVEKKNQAVAWSTGIDVAIALVIVAVWAALYRAPFMQRTVTFNWASYLGVKDALSAVPVLAFARFPQFIMAGLVILGIIWTLFHARWMWLDFGYFIFWLFYLISVSSEGDLKHILAGFWYTDSYRLAASAVFCAIPLAGIGLWVLCDVCWKIFDGSLADFSLKSAQGARARRGLAIVLTTLVVVLDLIPSIPFGNVTLHLGFHDVMAKIRSDNDPGHSARGARIYTDAQRDFVQRAKVITGNSVVINQPFDGSAYAYPVDGMNVYYKSLDGNWMGPATQTSTDIMHGMGDITSPKVARALNSVHAKYFLLLDNSGKYRKTLDPGWLRDEPLGIGYSPYNWGDMDKLRSHKHIKGMTLVLSEGKNRLYRLDTQE